MDVHDGDGAGALLLRQSWHSKADVGADGADGAGPRSSTARQRPQASTTGGMREVHGAPRRDEAAFWQIAGRRRPGAGASGAGGGGAGRIGRPRPRRPSALARHRVRGVDGGARGEITAGRSGDGRAWSGTGRGARERGRSGAAAEAPVRPPHHAPTRRARLSPGALPAAQSPSRLRRAKPPPLQPRTQVTRALRARVHGWRAGAAVRPRERYRRTAKPSCAARGAEHAEAPSRSPPTG